MSFRYFLIVGLFLGLCVMSQAQSLFAPQVTTFRALVRDFDETSGGYSPAWSPDGKQIAYLSAADNSLWVATLDGQNLLQPAQHVRLSPQNHPNPQRFVPPSFREMRHVDWSPVNDGTGNRIAFVGGDSGLWLAEGNVTAAPPRLQFTLLVRGEESPLPRLLTPRWSPDGKRIAFLKIPMGSPASSLWLLNVSQRKVRQIFPGAVAGEPVWSPDGKWLACTVRGDREEGSPARGRWDIWRISAEGDEPLPLTREGTCSMPRWSPDGKRIAYVCTTPRPAEQESDPCKVDIYDGFGRNPANPAVAVSVRTDNGVEFHVPALYVVNADGTQRTALTETLAPASATVRELFDKARNDMNTADEDSRRQLLQTLRMTAVREVHLDTQPSWSSDGKRLAFVRVNFVAQRGIIERRCVWTVDVETKRAEPLTVGGAEFSPVWSPRGSLLMFSAKRLLALGERVEGEARAGNRPPPTPAGAARAPRPRIQRLESLPEIWLMEWNDGK